MKRTTTTTHRYNADGKLIETTVVEHVEDESVPNAGGQIYPYYPSPYTTPWVVTTYTSGGTTGVQGINTGGGGSFYAVHDDDDGTAGVPAVA